MKTPKISCACKCRCGHHSKDSREILIRRLCDTQSVEQARYMRRRLFTQPGAFRLDTPNARLSLSEQHLDTRYFDIIGQLSNVAGISRARRRADVGNKPPPTTSPDLDNGRVVIFRSSHNAARVIMRYTTCACSAASGRKFRGVS